jgi:hypothetical protein
MDRSKIQIPGLGEFPILTMTKATWNSCEGPEVDERESFDVYTVQ